MAKRKKQSVIDQMPNRKYVNVSCAAATTTVAYTSIDTELGARSPMGWMINRIDVQPNALLDGWQNADATLRFQVQTGDQTALRTVDEEEVICTMDVTTNFVTSGRAFIPFPRQWMGPIIIATKKITCLLQGSDDASPLQAAQSTIFTFTIWYNYVDMTGRTWLEVAEAKGIV